MAIGSVVSGLSTPFSEQSSGRRCLQTWAACRSARRRGKPRPTPALVATDPFRRWTWGSDGSECRGRTRDRRGPSIRQAMSSRCKPCSRAEPGPRSRAGTRHGRWPSCSRPITCSRAHTADCVMCRSSARADPPVICRGSRLRPQPLRGHVCMAPIHAIEPYLNTQESSPGLVSGSSA